MSRTTQGILAAAASLLVLALDRTLAIGLSDAARASLDALLIAGSSLAVWGLQRRIPRGDYAEGPVPTTSTEVLPDTDLPPMAMP